MVVVAVTGRRMGRADKWPYSGASALPGAYLDAITRAGAQAVIVDDVLDASELLDRVDGLVLTGGPDVDPGCYGQRRHPQTYGTDRHIDGYECELAALAIARSIPVLAICRGIQILNVARGGTLFQHIPDDPGVAAHGRPGEGEGARLHAVKLEPASLVAEVMGADQVRVSCHHHQAVDALGDGLRVTSRGADGIVEAVELDGAFVLAVQWHPEDTAGNDVAQQRLFDALVRQAQPA